MKAQQNLLFFNAKNKMILVEKNCVIENIKTELEFLLEIFIEIEKRKGFCYLTFLRVICTDFHYYTATLSRENLPREKINVI